MIRNKLSRSFFIGLIIILIITLFVFLFADDKENPKPTKNEIYIQVARPDAVRIASIKNELQKYVVDFNSPLFSKGAIVKSDDTIINSNHTFEINFQN